MKFRFCMVAALVLPGFALAAADKSDKMVTIATPAIDFSPTFVCTATNVGSVPVSVSIELLSPQSGTALSGSTTVTTILQPGFGTSNEFTLQVGFTSGFCKVTHTGGTTAVRAAACSKAAQNGGCQGTVVAR